jgi:exosortase A-associated hydrolase 2
MATIKPHPFYLQANHGRLFCLAFENKVRPIAGKAVMIVPPFAEEMNRCRRQLFLIAQSLADAGINVLFPDLRGTGESDGDFADARLQCWFDDLTRCVTYLQENGLKNLILLGTRFGALLAAALANQLPVNVEQLILLNPVLNGEQYMNQFLRLRLAADMVSASETKLTTTDLRQQLKSQLSLEVAGYQLADELVSAVDGLRLIDFLRVSKIHTLWIEVSQAAQLSPAATRLLETLGTHSVETHAVQGDAFWSTLETTTVPGLASRVKDILFSTGR